VHTFYRLMHGWRILDGRWAMRIRLSSIGVAVAWIGLMSSGLAAISGIVAAETKKETVWSAQEAPIYEVLRGLRKLPDDVRAGTTKELALKIRQLPATDKQDDIGASSCQPFNGGRSRAGNSAGSGEHPHRSAARKTTA